MLFRSGRAQRHGIQKGRKADPREGQAGVGEAEQRRDRERHGLVQGVLQPVVNWWFGHNYLGLWMTPVAVGTAYYLIPKIIGRPATRACVTKKMKAAISMASMAIMAKTFITPILPRISQGRPLRALISRQVSQR